MKNIYIIGVPRTGKSTLSKLIKAKYPEFNIISFEAVRNGFIKAFPELEMKNRNSEVRKKAMPQFLTEFIQWNNTLTGYGNIVEGSFCSVETIFNLIDLQDIIICLGFNNRSLDEIVNGIMKYDTCNDYTKTWTREQIEKHFYDSVKKDRENYEFCEKYNINYWDTYDNRQEIFIKILEYIEKSLNEKQL